jgi:RHS repeat-associated protein
VDTASGMNSLGSVTTNIWVTRVPGGPNQYKVQRVYQTYFNLDNNWAPPFGPYLVQETIDPDNNPKTTTYNYNTYSYANGTTLPLASIQRPDGSWTEYQNFDGSGRAGLVYTSQQNVPLAQYYNSANNMEYEFANVNESDYPDDPTIYPNIPRATFQDFNGAESMKYTFYPSNTECLTIVASSQTSWDDPANLVTITTYYATGPNTNRVQSVLNPDGTMQLYAYAQAADGTRTNTVYSGMPNAGQTAIVDGTEIITIVGPVGQMISRTQIDIASGLTTAQETYSSYDPFGRPQCVTYLDGTSNVTTYACCGVESTVDRDGVATYYQYDAAKRLIGTTRLGITTTYGLDALGHVLQTVQTGTDGSQITLSQSQYDLSGQLVAETNALGGVTTHGETIGGSGGLVRTTTYPDGGTKIEQYYLDRSLASVTGTAVHGKAYGFVNEGAPDNQVSSSCAVETNLDNSGNPTSEWTKTFTDSLGRTVEVLYPGAGYYNSGLQQSFSGPANISYYNGIGQLAKQIDPDGVCTLYQYDPKGGVAYTAADMEQTGVIDVGGIDRITWTTNDVVIDHGTPVNRSRTYAWLDGQSSGTLASVSENSVDGLRSWQINYRDANTALTNQTVTSYASNLRTVTSTAPDGSYTINTYVAGQLLNSARFDATGKQIGGTSYSYDAHGRQYQVTDARNGTTTYGYNAADQVATVTTPSPGNGLAPETTTTLYDNMLRPYSVIQPDGTTVNSVYLLTGELALQYGSRTYPVAYGYDYAGRMQSMTNWSSFTSLGGARVTTWNYDGQRGWLNNKVYADGNGPVYAYTPAGRLQTRTWARTDANGNPITTTYGYDNAGGLTNIFYSDTTPSVTNNYDRLGRLTQQVTANYQLNSAYNLAGQLMSESYAAGPLAGLGITNQYDADMRRTKLSILNSSSAILAATAHGYDAASRLATVADGHGNTATYNYLANSPLVSQMTFQQNGATRVTTTKTYDDLNRLTQKSSQPTASGLPPVTFNYSYNSANQRTQDKLADGSYWVYNYDSLGQVISGHKYFRDGTPMPGQQFDYGFDTIGNRTQTRAGGDQTGGNQRVANYSVNNLNQIISRDFPGTNDIVGAALATNSVTLNGQPAWHKWEYFWGTVTTNNTAAPAWLTATVASGGASNTGSVYLAQTPEQFSYDADGNMVSDGRWTYTWDAENRLIGMTVSTAAGPQYQLTFAYDAKGRRMQKTVSTIGISNTINFLYDGWNPVGILNSQSTLVQSFMWGSDLSGSLQGAGGVGGLLEVSSYGTGTSTTNSFTVFDGNGNIAALVNAADGTSLAGYEYGPFGEVIRATGPMAKANPFRFSTEYYDDESDIIMYPHRPYSPSTGRWLSRDPVGELGFELLSRETARVLSDGAKLYGFCGNDPINAFDMLGLFDIHWKGNITDAQKQAIQNAMNRVKDRANALIKQMDDNIKNLKKCPCPAYDDLAKKLEGLKKVLQGMAKVINDPKYDLNVYVESTPGASATYWPSPVPWYNDHLTLDPGWFNAGDADSTMFHEISHSQGTEDQTANDYNNAHLIEGLMTVDKENWIIWKFDKKKADEKCKSGGK